MDLNDYIQLTTPIEFPCNKKGNRNPTLKNYPNLETEVDKYETKKGRQIKQWAQSR